MGLGLRVSRFIVFFCFLLGVVNASAKESFKNNFEWKNLPSFDGGVISGAITSTSGDIIVAAGADNSIFVLAEGASSWRNTTLKLEGVVESTPMGLVAINGKNISLYTYVGGKLEELVLSTLPQKIVEYSATTSDNNLYIASEKLYAINLKSSKPEWQSYAAPKHLGKGDVAISQNGADSRNIYLFGEDSRGVIFNTSTKQWRESKDMGVSVAGGEAIALANSHILYNNANNDIFVYNTITDSWSRVNDVPMEDKNSFIAPYKKGFVVLGSESHYGTIVNKPTFGFVNWLVLVLYMLSMLYMGYYFMRKNNKNTDDFFKGGGRIPWWASGISLFATMLSAITFMAIPAKSFATDWRYFPMAITILLMAFPVIKYYLPFFKRLNVTTAYEYLEARFNYAIRLIASSIFIIFMVARMALTLYLPSLALTTVIDIDIYTCITLMGIITLIYSTMGGAEAVIWSDVVQGVILLGGAIFIIIYLLFEIPGGIPTVIDVIVSEDKMRMFDFSFAFSSATFWVIILGGLANNLISYTSDQTAIQRYLTSKSEAGARKTIMLNGVLSTTVSVLFYFIGTALYVFYVTSEGKTNYMMESNDAIFPHFIMAEIPIGLAGLIIAAIFAATMSTISSNINSLSTAYTVDIFRHFSRNTDDNKELSVARVSGVVLGLVGIGMAVLMATMNILSLLDFFNYLLGLLSSGIAALFFIGIFMPRVGAKSALCGFLLGNAVLILISVHTNVSFLLYGCIGIVLTVVFSFIFSLFIRNEKNIKGFTWKTIKKEEV